MSWRAHTGSVHKIEQLDSRVRPQFEAFLDLLDERRIRVALGDFYRPLAREWDVWKLGRRPPEEGDANDPQTWVVVNPGALVTRVPPGSGKGPHPHRLAGDIYPVDEHGALMMEHDLQWLDTITQMWTLAEACGLDALGHARPDRPGDEYASFDPCHFQALNWRALVAPATTKEV